MNRTLSLKSRQPGANAVSAENKKNEKSRKLPNLFYINVDHGKNIRSS